MRRLWTFCLLLACAAAAGAETGAETGPAVPVFAEETASAGLQARFTGDWEQMVGGGVAAFDCNGDRRPDIAIAGGTAPATLWVNESAPGGALRLLRADAGVEVTGVSGLYPLDIDGDGLTDLVLLRVGEDLVLKGKGGCRFERANEAWHFDGGDLWSTAFAATWEAGASWPTLAIGSYIDRTQDAFPWGSCTENRLLRPGPNAGFAKPLPLLPSFCALSMLFSDWNRSGQPALRVSNDREYYKGGQEQLWHIPPGQPPRLYTEGEGWQRLRVWGMGIASADLDFDGFPEYFLTSMADNKLQTLADPASPLPRYADVAFPRGAIAQRPYTGGDVRPSTAWHAAFEDLNNDGFNDLFIAKGNVSEMPDFAQADPNNLLLQGKDGIFTEVGDKAGIASLLTARGAALADFNLDGQMDLVVANRNGPAQLWRNGGTKGHWIALALHQPGPNRDAIGAWVEVDTGDHVQQREVTSGGGHAGGGLGWLHFGLGPRPAARVRVIWPDGVVSDWADLGADGFYDLARDRAPVPWHPAAHDTKLLQNTRTPVMNHH